MIRTLVLALTCWSDIVHKYFYDGLLLSVDLSYVRMYVHVHMYARESAQERSWQQVRV